MCFVSDLLSSMTYFHIFKKKYDIQNKIFYRTEKCGIAFDKKTGQKKKKKNKVNRKQFDRNTKDFKWKEDVLSKKNKDKSFECQKM